MTDDAMIANALAIKPTTLQLDRKILIYKQKTGKNYTDIAIQVELVINNRIENHLPNTMSNPYTENGNRN